MYTIAMLILHFDGRICLLIIQTLITEALTLKKIRDSCDISTHRLVSCYVNFSIVIARNDMCANGFVKIHVAYKMDIGNKK